MTDAGPASGGELEAMVRVRDLRRPRVFFVALAVAGVVAAFAYAWWCAGLVAVWLLFELVARNLLGKPAATVGLIRLTDRTFSVSPPGYAVSPRFRPLERPLDAVTSRQVWRRADGGAVVELRFTGGHAVIVEVSDPARAERLLRAGGARWNAPRFQLARGNLPRFVGALAFLGILACVAAVLPGAFLTLFELVLSGGTPGPIGAATLTTAALLPWLTRLLRLTWARVGTDGVSIERDRTVRFVPAASIQRVERHPDGVRLHLARAPGLWGALRGDALVLRVRPSGVPPFPLVPAAPPEEESRTRDAFVAREQLFAHVERLVGGADAADPARALDLVSRHGRLLSTWAASLEGALAQGGAGYRDVAIDPAQLVAITENPAAPADARLGAAYLGARSTDPELRRRARLAADACAEPRMRDALDRAANGDLQGAAALAGLAPDAAEADAEAEAELAAEEEQRAGRTRG